MRKLLIVSCAVLALCFVGAVLSAQSMPPTGVMAWGTVTAVDADKKTITVGVKNQSGKVTDAVFAVTDATRIVSKGVAKKFSDIKLGALVGVNYKKADDGSVVATMILL